MEFLKFVLELELRPVRGVTLLLKDVLSLAELVSSSWENEGSVLVYESYVLDLEGLQNLASNRLNAFPFGVSEGIDH